MTTAAVAPEPVFVDTNVLVYAAVPAFPLHVDARMRLTELEAAGACLWISRQTLREYLSALSRPSAYSPPIPMTSFATAVPDRRRVTSRPTVGRTAGSGDPRRTRAEPRGRETLAERCVRPSPNEHSPLITRNSPLFALDFKARATGQAHREPRRMVSIGARREARQAG